MRHLLPFLLLLLLSPAASALNEADLFIKGDPDFCRLMTDGRDGKIDYLWSSAASTHYFKLTVKHVSDDSSISNDEFSWTSSNPSIAEFTESSSGTTATLNVKSFGTCTITATDKTKNVSTSVTFTSKYEVSPRQIVFTTEKNYFVVGEPQKVRVTVIPEDADYCYFTWNGGRSIDTEHNVTFDWPGEQEIPFKLVAAGGVKIFNTSKYNCVNPILSTQLYWGAESRSERNEATLILGTDLSVINQILTVDIDGNVSNDFGYSTNWELSDKSLASLKTGYNSCSIKGLKEGTVTLTATTIPLETTNDLVINIRDGEYVHIDKVTIWSDGEELEESYETSLTEGQTMQLSAHVFPEDATNKSVYWESERPEIASVDHNGLVTAKTAGSTIIKAKCLDGSNASINVWVIAKAGILIPTISDKHDIEIYSIGGTKISPDKILPPGVYIVRRDKKVQKLIIR